MAPSGTSDDESFQPPDDDCQAIRTLLEQRAAALQDGDRDDIRFDAQVLEFAPTYDFLVDATTSGETRPCHGWSARRRG